MLALKARFVGFRVDRPTEALLNVLIFGQSTIRLSDPLVSMVVCVFDI